MSKTVVTINGEVLTQEQLRQFYLLFASMQEEETRKERAELALLIRHYRAKLNSSNNR